MIPYAELETFFSDLITRSQAAGISCGITSGMACVHFGVAATTKECEVLCCPNQSDDFRTLIANTRLRGLLPQYRGNISPPLDARWMCGGWTSHFTWKTSPEETCLDVFGIAPRASSPWEDQLIGIYARFNVVAEMKRTNREKDWPFATSLGGAMLLEGDPRGWLHLHDLEVIRQFLKKSPIPPDMAELRPLLRLAPFKNTLAAKRILLAERLFWSELDALRIHLFQKHLRPYLSEVRKTTAGNRGLSLNDGHTIRINAALQHLPMRPLRDYGLEKMVLKARENVALQMAPSVLDWLPCASRNFFGL